MVTCQDRRLRRCLVVGLGDGSQKKLFQSAANWCWDIDLHWVSMYFQKNKTWFGGKSEIYSWYSQLETSIFRRIIKQILLVIADVQRSTEIVAMS